MSDGEHAHGILDHGKHTHLGCCCHSVPNTHLQAVFLHVHLYICMHLYACTNWPVDLADWWIGQETVHERFRTEFERHFVFKRVPRSKMDAMHQHPSIDILLLRRRSVPQQG